MGDRQEEDSGFGGAFWSDPGDSASVEEGEFSAGFEMPQNQDWDDEELVEESSGEYEEEVVESFDSRGEESGSHGSSEEVDEVESVVNEEFDWEEPEKNDVSQSFGENSSGSGDKQGDDDYDSEEEEIRDTDSEEEVESSANETEEGFESRASEEVEQEGFESSTSEGGKEEMESSSYDEGEVEQQDTASRSKEGASEKQIGEEEEGDDSTFLEASMLEESRSRSFRDPESPTPKQESVRSGSAKSSVKSSSSNLADSPDEKPIQEKSATRNARSARASTKEAEERFHQSFGSLDNPVPKAQTNEEAGNSTARKPESVGENRSVESSQGGSHRRKKSAVSQLIVKNQKCKSLAVLGTMSDAGKSIINAGLCRVLSNGGMRPAPFKGQNMSNNASPALLPEPSRRKKLHKSFKKAVGGKFPRDNGKLDRGYGEIGTAQSLQAEACRLVPRVEMNPVLLKSGGQNQKGEFLCSVVVLGKQVARETYGDLGNRTTQLRSMVLESHQELAQATECDVVVMEGAGSCTEINLMERDIVNLPLVRALNCPWLLVANIDCGGVFAQIVGTKMCVSHRDWELCAGIIVNKLRGEAKYFEPGPKMIEDLVGKPVFIVPFLRDLNLPEEDGMGIERRLAWESSGQDEFEDDAKSEAEKKPLVVVVAYPHTAIADDLCPLEGDPRFRVQWRSRRIPKPYPHTTAVILPGSRLTRLDLKWLHDSGWAAFLRQHVGAGGNVLGLCGGYQMLGWSVEDPLAVEGRGGKSRGMGLLPIRTTLTAPEVKVVAPRKGTLYPSGAEVQGFELHCGQSEILTEMGSPVGHQIHPLVMFEGGKAEGMCSGRVRGTYLHGILWSPVARAELLVPSAKDFPILKAIEVRDPLDRLADHLASCGLDYDTVKGMIDNHSPT